MPRILGKKKQDMIRIEKAWRGTCGKSTLERSVTGFVRKDSWQRFHHVPLISVLQLISRFLPWRTLRATYSFSFTWIKTRIECQNMQKTVRVILARDANIMYILYYIILYILYNIIESNYLTGLGSPSVKRWRVFQVPGTSRTSISEFQSCRKANSALRSSRTFLGLEW